MIDILIKAGIAFASLLSLGLGIVQSDRAQKRQDELIKSQIKNELAKKQRWRKKQS